MSLRDLPAKWRDSAFLLRQGVHEYPEYAAYADKLEMCADELSAAILAERERKNAEGMPDSTRKETLR